MYTKILALISGELISILKNKQFRVSSVGTYDFSTLYTTLPHDLIKVKLINLINRTLVENKNYSWLAIIPRLSLLMLNIKDIIIGLMKSFVKL